MLRRSISGLRNLLSQSSTNPYAFTQQSRTIAASMASSKPLDPTQNELAQRLAALHVPGAPLILTNVWDAASAGAIAALPGTQALATASWAVAAVAGLADDDLTLEANVAAVRAIAPVAAREAKPLTVDLQSGYGERLDEAVRAVLAAGAVGCNLEDRAPHAARLLPLPDAAARVARAKAAAAAAGCPDFHVNARCDALVVGGSVEQAVERGRAYLDAGAGSVFVWGGPGRGMSRGEVETLVKALDGAAVNVIMRTDDEPGILTASQLKDIGVARISIGPGLLTSSLKFIQEGARKVLES